MKKLIFLILFTFLLSSCATTDYHRTYTQKQGLMLLDNTEMPMNKKYNQQKRKKGTWKSRKNAKKYYRMRK